MYTRPPELADETIAASLAEHWHVEASALSYEPVGFGAHHWKATDAAGIEWFLTVHDLTAHRNDDTETEDDVWHRLIASFGAARALQQHGVDCVLAPTSTNNGRVAERIDDRFSLAVHPFLRGHPAGEFGGFTSSEDRLAALDLVVQVHRHSEVAAPFANEDDLVVPHIGEIPVAIAELATVWDAGPYGEAARAHLEQHATGVERLLVGYERLADEVRQRRDAAVLTHGEPHAANVFVVEDRFLLIDWDTALVAAPERDLWHLDPGDGSILDAYRQRTGVVPLPAAVDLYRLWWDLTEIGGYLGVVRRPHTDTTDIATSWKGLQEYLDPAARAGPVSWAEPPGTVATVPELGTVRVAAVQATPVILDADATIDKTIDLLGEAASGGASLVVFPECFVSLYPTGTWAAQAATWVHGGNDLWERMWTSSVDISGPLVDRLVKACADHGVHLAIGVNEREDHRPGSLYNSLLLLGPDGLLHRHRKLMATMHERVFHGAGSGNDLDVTELPGIGRVGGLLCWENRMPLARWRVYQGGPQIWLAPTADDSEGWLVSMRHIALEAGAFVVSVAQYIPSAAFPSDFPLELPPDAEVFGRGGSCIVSPTGDVIAGQLYDAEGIVYADCDLRQALHAKRYFDVAGHYSRADVLDPEGQ